jgi:hypothetical protein
MQPRTATREAVHVEDVDEIIEIAARMKDADADRLSPEDLEAVALELGIEPQYVARAVKALQERRDDAQRAAQARRQRQRLAALVGAAMLAALLVAFGGAALLGRQGLTERHNALQARRAQVHNVAERQDKVEARLHGLPLTPDREAELIGAENRVRVEARRYDEAATDYNNYATSALGALGALLTDLPDAAPLSPEIQQW